MSTTGFLRLSTMDIWDQIIPVEAHPVHCRTLVAPLASTHKMPVVSYGDSSSSYGQDPPLTLNYLMM